MRDELLRTHPIIRCCLWIVIAIAISTPSYADQGAPTTFVSFYDIPGGSQSLEPPSVSDDGLVVAGQSSQPFRWTYAGGLELLGDLPGGFSGGSARGISSDGSVIVGWLGNGSGVEYKAFRWTQATGMVDLGALPGGFIHKSFANAVSADGMVVVGESLSAFGGEAFRWTAVDGIVGLGDLAGGSFGSEALAVSFDGSVIAGTGASPTTEAFRWTAAGGMVGLGYHQGGNFSRINAMTDNGLALIGETSDSSGFASAVRWESGTGFVTLPGCSLCNFVGQSVSANGDVVGGYRWFAPLQLSATVWDDTNGLQYLEGLLSDRGIGTNGWNLDKVTGISADGTTYVGTATKVIDQFIVEAGWVAVLGDPAVEVPTMDPRAIAILLSAMTALACLRLRGRTIANRALAQARHRASLPGP
ncbi:MAG TPA: PEP-CTERM sorting domain-containing protein [Planctomycetaceae bacterium]|nr:PEP-CTERM sorting domain-containing protein [Planctomycetaceae bacterium]